MYLSTSRSNFTHSVWYCLSRSDTLHAPSQLFSLSNSLNTHDFPLSIHLSTQPAYQISFSLSHSLYIPFLLVSFFPIPFYWPAYQIHFPSVYNYLHIRMSSLHSIHLPLSHSLPSMKQSPYQISLPPSLYYFSITIQVCGNSPLYSFLSVTFLSLLSHTLSLLPSISHILYSPHSNA